MTAAAFLVPAGRGILRVAGEDRVAFLQGLVTNDVTKAVAPAADRPGHALYAGLLSAQGRVLHDFFIVASGEAFLLDCEADRLEDLKRRLSLYRLRSKVTLAAAEELGCALIFGAGALAALALPSTPGEVHPADGGVVYVDPRHAALGARAILPRGQLVQFPALGLPPGEADAYDRLRLSLGVPDGSRDLLVEKALPMESGFDALNGVDWNKGCYVGQELTARMKYRDLVRRRLMPVRIDGPVPPPATKVLLGDQEIGEMRSANGPVGLALLRLDALDEASRGQLPLTAAQARLVVSPPS